MERNERTFLLELLPGDRFYFLRDKKKEVFEKTDFIFYNIITENGKKLLPFDKKGRDGDQVVFLRHKNK